MDCYTVELLGWLLSPTGNDKAKEVVLEEADQPLARRPMFYTNGVSMRDQTGVHLPAHAAT